MTGQMMVEWALGKRFEMSVVVDGTKPKPGFVVRKTLDFTVVSVNAAEDTVRVHVNDPQRSRQLLDWQSFLDGVAAGVIKELAEPPIVHPRDAGDNRHSRRRQLQVVVDGVQRAKVR
jgi:hypothetical protein